MTPEPVAAASLGQVYRGVLRATGEEVAVKVQRPGIGEGMAIDMLLLRRLMGLVDEHLPQVSQPLVPLVDEFAARLFAELDYEQEGRNAERFQVRRGFVFFVFLCVVWVRLLNWGGGRNASTPLFAPHQHTPISQLSQP